MPDDLSILHDLAGGLAPLAKPQHQVVYEGRAARTHAAGDGLQYPWGYEHRDAAELQRIVDRLPGTPVTLDHPDNSESNCEGLVKKGARAHVIGVVQTARVQDGHAVVSILVTDEQGIAAIRDGTAELSLGYLRKRVMRDDGLIWHENTEIDHLAVVTRARCGPTCEIRTDAVADCKDSPAPCACKSRAIVYAPAISMPDSTPDLNAQLASALADAAAQRVRADAAVARVAEVEGLLTAAEAAADNAARELETLKTAHAVALDAEKARADAAEASIAEKVAEAKAAADAASDAKVEARVNLLADAAMIMGEVDRTKTDREIKLAVIKHVDGREVAADKIDLPNYVDAIYDGALERHAQAAGSRADTLKTIVDARAPEVVKTEPEAEPKKMAAEVDATAAMNDRITNAHRTKRN